jgi:transcriptional regulator NrdR family protein
MLCPNCGEDNSRVIKTYHKTNENVIERVRQCLCCGIPWITEEKPVENKIKKTFVT